MDPTLDPLTLSENATPVHSLVFDIDFLCKSSSSNRSTYFDQTFFVKLHEIVREVIHPTSRCSSELVVFQAHGHHSADNTHKFSFHVYINWPEAKLGVDKLRMRQIRWFVLQKIYSKIEAEDPYWCVLQRHLERDCCSTWGQVFDKSPCNNIAALRLPFNDKGKTDGKDEWIEGAFEGRPVEENFEKYFGYLARCEAKMLYYNPKN